MPKLKPAHKRRFSYELFIVLLTILSLLNLLLIIFAPDNDVKEVALSINLLISLIFMVDFLLRLRFAPSKRQYFLHQHGWLDLIGSVPIPGFNIARIWRVILTQRLLQKAGAREIVSEVARNRADSAIIFIALAVIYLLEFGSIFILGAEAGAPNANITTAQDAIWWVLVTISTVGYGDYFPVTWDGRFVAIFVIIAGVGVFGTLSGYLAKIFLGKGTGDNGLQSNEDDSRLEMFNTLLQSNLDRQKNHDESLADLHARLDKIERLIEDHLIKR